MRFKRTYGASPRFWLNNVEVDESTYLAADKEAGRRLKEMFDSGQAASSIVTDSTYLAGKHRQFERNQKLGDAYKRITEKHGGDTTGKVYLSQLAKFPGDPQAWVSGRGDIQRVLEERGWGSEGAVNVMVREPLEEPKSLAGDVCPKVLEQRTKQYIANCPEPVKDRNEVKEMIRDKIRPRFGKAGDVIVKE